MFKLHFAETQAIFPFAEIPVIISLQYPQKSLVVRIYSFFAFARAGAFLFFVIISAT